ncbi:uncharacterized protein LOC121381572 [Gigantopelta aegis]|uniref:uncharacterized protein LOC121381572 n=1 Tax=Gigantopelta aegis TaxID=1735272 RepID=UPI001B888F3B|nr:uncharacterized protein LOC121381572 [Gigantopelta aegis]
MSLKTRIRGFTAWVNLRLIPYNHLLNNVIMDLLTGTSMKYLVESITGRDFTKLESFDGLSQQQKQTRVEWMLQELKRCNVIPLDIGIDCRMFAMRSADHVFDLLWRLVSHDIWFVWERAEYLQHEDKDIITQVKFKWTPEPPPKKKKKAKPRKSLLSGFGSSAVVDDEPVDNEPEVEWVKFPNSDFMKNFKRKRTAGKYPSPDQCILQLVNAQLKKTKEGKTISCYSIDDLVDSRILCTLVNSFVPNTFTTDLLLNDRWTINIALRTAEKMFYNETQFDSEDLAEADPMAVCAYFTSFFMVAYKYRQCKAVAERVNWIHQLIRECYHELEKYPPVVTNLQELQHRKEMKSNIEGHKEAIQKMEKRFDVKYCKKWVDHVDTVQTDTRKEIRNKIKSRFDVLTIPRSITINDLCLSYVINLSLTNGSGFYKAEGKEILTEGRRLVLRNRETGEFTDDFTSKSKVPVRQLLKLPGASVVEINPSDYPNYDLFFEAQSRNKHFKTGTQFLYQVFPGNTITWNRMFIRAAKENEADTIEKLLTFFRGHPKFINSREPKTGNTALHCACRFGHYEIVALLLEYGANIDAKNNFHCTPLYAAIEGLHRRVCHLLIEWGCDLHCKNIRGQTPIESCKNDEFRKYLADLYDHYSSIIPQIMNGDMDLLEEVIRQHRSGEHVFCSLTSRCVNGSTLLHTAAYYGHKSSIQELLRQRVGINLKDYKGATPLHRAKDHDTIQMLLESGAVLNAVDTEGNTPLHVKCYGEMDKPSDLTSIELLLSEGADPVRRNNRNLLPIHCCAMQGRVDVMKMLIKADGDEKILKALNSEEGRNPPSLIHLALANDFLQCADWLLQNGFKFKAKEIDILLKRVLTDQIKLTNRADAVKFLLDCGADPNPSYPDGNSALHYAASLPGSTDILETLLAYGAEADCVNDDGCTPLFFATQANNQFAACVLIAQGTNVRQKNFQGLTAFDNIVDFDEWIDSGYFTDEIKARLKAYSLKHARDLIRAISKRVKPNPSQSRPDHIPSDQMIHIPSDLRHPCRPRITVLHEHHDAATHHG